jgi:hypothetical protein
MQQSKFVHRHNCWRKFTADKNKYNPQTPFTQCWKMSWQLVHGRTRGGGVGSAFEHLQSIVSSCSSTKSTSNCSIQTKTDAKFDATTHLLLTASRLSSAANVLDEYVKVISSDESSRENQIY